MSSSGHETSILRRFSGARAICSCGWGTAWFEMQPELALDLAESEADQHASDTRRPRLGR